MNGKLTPKREAFCHAYVETGNASEAYRRAFNVSTTKPETIYESASRLLTDPKVSARVAQLQAEAAKRNEITIDRVMQEIAAVAFANLDDVAPWDESGPRLIPSAELDRKVKASVGSIKVKRRREYKGRGEDQEAWEVEEMQVSPNDKLKALELLGKYTGAFVERLEHSGPGGSPLEVDSVERIIADPEAARAARAAIRAISRGHRGLEKGKPG